MNDYPGTPFEAHLKIYKERIEIPDYIESYLDQNYWGYINGITISDGIYKCTCGEIIPTPGHGMFVLVTDEYQDRKKEILENNYGRIICDKCNKLTDFLTPLEYIDLSKKIIVMTLVYDSDDRLLKYWEDYYKNNKYTQEMKSNGYKFYVVTGREELLKIIQNL